MNEAESQLYNELIKNYEFNRVQSYLKGQEYLSLIGSTLSEEVHIIDPYLDQPIYIERLILAAKDLHEIYILTDFDKSELNPNEIKKRFTEFCTNNNLRSIFFLKSTSYSSRNPLHDRFILSQNRGWMIGTSFNHIGNRQTYIIDVDNYSYLRLLDDGKKPKYSKLFYLKIHFQEMWNSIPQNTVLKCEAPNDIQF